MSGYAKILQKNGKFLGLKESPESPHGWEWVPLEAKDVPGTVANTTLRRIQSQGTAEEREGGDPRARVGPMERLFQGDDALDTTGRSVSQGAETMGPGEALKEMFFGAARGLGAPTTPEEAEGLIELFRPDKSRSPISRALLPDPVIRLAQGDQQARSEALERLASGEGFAPQNLIEGTVPVLGPMLGHISRGLESPYPEERAGAVGEVGIAAAPLGLKGANTALGKAGTGLRRSGEMTTAKAIVNAPLRGKGKHGKQIEALTQEPVVDGVKQPSRVSTFMEDTNTISRSRQKLYDKAEESRARAGEDIDEVVSRHPEGTLEVPTAEVSREAGRKIRQEADYSLPPQVITLRDGRQVKLPQGKTPEGTALIENLFREAAEVRRNREFHRARDLETDMGARISQKKGFNKQQHGSNDLFKENPEFAKRELRGPLSRAVEAAEPDLIDPNRRYAASKTVLREIEKTLNDSGLPPTITRQIVRFGLGAGGLGFGAMAGSPTIMGIGMLAAIADASAVLARSTLRRTAQGYLTYRLGKFLETGAQKDLLDAYKSAYAMQAAAQAQKQGQKVDGAAQSGPKSGQPYGFEADPANSQLMRDLADAIKTERWDLADNLVAEYEKIYGVEPPFNVGGPLPPDSPGRPAGLLTDGSTDAPRLGDGAQPPRQPGPGEGTLTGAHLGQRRLAPAPDPIPDRHKFVEQARARQQQMTDAQTAERVSSEGPIQLDGGIEPTFQRLEDGYMGLARDGGLHAAEYIRKGISDPEMPFNKDVPAPIARRRTSTPPPDAPEGTPVLIPETAKKHPNARGTIVSSWDMGPNRVHRVEIIDDKGKGTGEFTNMIVKRDSDSPDADSTQGESVESASAEPTTTSSPAVPSRKVVANPLEATDHNKSTTIRSLSPAEKLEADRVKNRPTEQIDKENREISSRLVERAKRVIKPDKDGVRPFPTPNGEAYAVIVDGKIVDGHTNRAQADKLYSEARKKRTPAPESDTAVSELKDVQDRIKPKSGHTGVVHDPRGNNGRGQYAVVVDGEVVDVHDKSGRAQARLTEVLGDRVKKAEGDTAPSVVNAGAKRAKGIEKKVAKLRQQIEEHDTLIRNIQKEIDEVDDLREAMNDAELDELEANETHLEELAEAREKLVADLKKLKSESESINPRVSRTPDSKSKVEPSVGALRKEIDGYDTVIKNMEKDGDTGPALDKLRAERQAKVDQLNKQSKSESKPAPKATQKPDDDIDQFLADTDAELDEILGGGEPESKLPDDFEAIKSKADSRDTIEWESDDGSVFVLRSTTEGKKGGSHTKYTVVNAASDTPGYGGRSFNSLKEAKDWAQGKSENKPAPKSEPKPAPAPTVTKGKVGATDVEFKVPITRSPAEARQAIAEKHKQRKAARGQSKPEQQDFRLGSTKASLNDRLRELADDTSELAEAERKAIRDKLHSIEHADEIAAEKAAKKKADQEKAKQDKKIKRKNAGEPITREEIDLNSAVEGVIGATASNKHAYVVKGRVANPKIKESRHGEYVEVFVTHEKKLNSTSWTQVDEISPRPVLIKTLTKPTD